MGYRILLDSKFGTEAIYKRTKNEAYKEGDWIVCKNMGEFTRVIITNKLENEIMPELISFSFNLGFEVLDKNINPKAETGPDAIKWLVEFCQERREKLPEYLTHSEEWVHNQSMSNILSNSKEIYGL